MNIQPRIGQIVTVNISRVLSGGLFVDVIGQNTKGIIRQHELEFIDLADADKRKEYYKPGTELQAIVIDQRDDGRLELSLKQVRQDPWQAIAKRLQISQLVDGIVVNVESYGVFVELSLGVTGLLHVSKFPPWLNGAPAELFWPGDRVKVIVDAVDEIERRIGLTMLRLAEKRWLSMEESTPPTITHSSKKSDAQAEAQNVAKFPIERLLEQPPQRVLIVEDDPDHRKAVTDWLRRAGQNPYPVGSGEEALAVAPSFHPDLALVDLGLPGMNGVETLRRLVALQPEIRAVMMTAGYEADASDLEASGIKLLLKPLNVSELVDVLCKTSSYAETVTQEKPPGDVVQLESPVLTIPARPDKLSGLLQSLLERTKATKVILFSFDTVQRKVEILAQSGRGHLDIQALPGLARSPVRDVAEDEIIIHTDDAQHVDEARFRYLLPLLPFASCIGAPVSANLPTRAALFLFQTRQSAFSEVHRDFVIAYAYALANLLERQMFTQQSSDLQRLALLGQISQALVHEVNHRLSPVDFALDTLLAEFRDIDRMLGKVAEATEQGYDPIEQAFHNAGRSLDKLVQAIRMLIQTAKLFGQMAKIDHETGLVLLNEVATDVANLMHDTAQKQHVRIYVDIPNKVTVTHTKKALVRQILLNVVMNAIQQIGLYRPKEGGQIRISFSDTGHADEHFVCMHVEDDGPGIHRRLWRQIFQLGFTTRKEGSGLGLYISRSLVESLGGRLLVFESHLYWGTTFSIELPVRS